MKMKGVLRRMTFYGNIYVELKENIIGFRGKRLNSVIRRLLKGYPSHPITYKGGVQLKRRNEIIVWIDSIQWAD
jgi:hypothetical protein